MSAWRNFRTIPQGLKPLKFRINSARLRSCPFKAPFFGTRSNKASFLEHAVSFSRTESSCGRELEDGTRFTNHDFCACDFPTCGRDLCLLVLVQARSGLSSFDRRRNSFVPERNRHSSGAERGGSPGHIPGDCNAADHRYGRRQAFATVLGLGALIGCGVSALSGGGFVDYLLHLH